MGERIGVYPGSFDPPTIGHMDIIARAARLVDKLVVAPAINLGKSPLFTLEERVELIRGEIAAMPKEHSGNVVIEPFEGLLIDFAQKVGANVIFRGLRAVSDYEYEIQMASMNSKMNRDIETVFLAASDKYQFIASSLVKEIARLNGNIDPFLAPRVAERLREKIRAGA
jgi:pantetheine-phosphate adenylyltransferase